MDLRADSNLAKQIFGYQNRIDTRISRSCSEKKLVKLQAFSKIVEF